MKLSHPQVLKTSNPLTELSWQIQFFLSDRPVHVTASPILLGFEEFRSTTEERIQGKRKVRRHVKMSDVNVLLHIQ
ncbi:hypothetical protein ZIOFF_038135 [Zingiber officinale]|uniref:Uncharacterized protein n=1 Tax=Zingiber officinale TaxID=94328 RepID=A0A8J5GCG2_ZINOF|nr:hypothetical protein ZIOFF_038135 [Zingiber officinale]